MDMNVRGYNFAIRLHFVAFPTEPLAFVKQDPKFFIIIIIIMIFGSEMVKASSFMICGIIENVTDPKKRLFLTLRIPNYSKEFKKSPTRFWTYYVGNHRNLKKTERLDRIF